MSFPFEEVYNIYLLHLESEKYKEKYDGWEDEFSMSRAGQCYLKHYYYKHKYQRFPLVDLRKLRVPRLGTLLHNDFESMIHWIYENYRNDKINDDIVKTLGDRYAADKIEIYTEQVLTHDGKRGHSDIYIIIIKENHVEVYDLKSIAAWTWKIKFGKTDVIDNNKFAQYQLATYTKAIMLKHKARTCDMFLVYYKKDSSEMRTEPVGLNYLDKADEYWKKLKRFMKASEDDRHISQVVPHESIVIPVLKWECDWCNYRPHCDEITDNIGRLK
jgi:hypothetical protein